MPRGVYDRTKRRDPVQPAPVAESADDQWWPDGDDLTQYVPMRAKKPEVRRRMLTILEVFVRHMRLTRNVEAAIMATVSELEPYGVSATTVRAATAKWRHAYPARRERSTKSIEVLVAALGRQVQALTVEVHLLRDSLKKTR